MMEPIQKKIWFPAKTYGYGWGAPCTWQGWVVFIAYLLLVVSAPRYINVYKAPIVFGTYVTLLTAIFLIIVIKKGEKPNWRWGKKADDPK